VPAPWKSFWNKKIAANNKLIQAVGQGNITDVQQLIN
jgi:ankyrin repeat protein